MDRIVAVGIGSNLGDRHAHIRFARTRLQALLGHLRLSSVRETAPVGVAEPQPPYLNAVAVGASAASPRQLLDALLAIEREAGRERPYPNAPRTLDLDLLSVGSEIVSQPDLIVPHPRLADRQFVLEPLAEIAPEWRHPVSGETAAAILDRIRRFPPAPSASRR